MNDPNGLVYYDGEYHMFFQYNPYGDRWGHMSWGHAVSSDLLHWKELPIAIPETDVMAFSGSAVVDWSNSSGFGNSEKPPLVALYTGYNPVTKIQAQYVAYSNDRGRTWTRYGTQPVLDIGSTEFRDPKVFWYAPGRHWVMVLVRGAENRVAIYTSKDLKKWKFSSHFGPAGARGADWECPDLFELPLEGNPQETHWILKVSVGDRITGGGSGEQYFVGSFDGKRFRPDARQQSADPLWTDYGADFYASASWNDLPQNDTRRIWIAWATNDRYRQSTPEWPARGLMTLPRTVSLHNTPSGLRIAQKPIRELQTLRDGAVQAQNISLGAEESLLPIEGGTVELEIDVRTGTAEQIALAISDDHGYRTLVGVNSKVSEIFVDRTRSGPHFHDAFPERHTAPVRVADGHIKLHIFVDESIIEVFADSGEAVLTDRFFPSSSLLRWSAYARNGNASIDSLAAWHVKATNTFPLTPGSTDGR